MTKLVVQELITELNHDASVTSRKILHTVRPWIYKHGSPAGIFTVEIWQFGAKLGESSLTAAQIETNAGLNPNEFFHGPVQFKLATPVPINPGSFQVKLKATGYGFQESAYFGWVKPHEDFINNFTNPNDPRRNVLGIEFWTYVYDKRT